MGSLREIAPKLVSASQQHSTSSKQTSNFNLPRNNDNRLHYSFNYLSVITPGLIFVFIWNIVHTALLRRNRAPQMQNADVVRVAAQGITPK
jgi:hypothetical protein